MFYACAFWFMIGFMVGGILCVTKSKVGETDGRR